MKGLLVSSTSYIKNHINPIRQCLIDTARAIRRPRSEVIYWPHIHTLEAANTQGGVANSSCYELDLVITSCGQSLGALHKLRHTLRGGGVDKV